MAIGDVDTESLVGKMFEQSEIEVQPEKFGDNLDFSEEGEEKKEEVKAEEEEKPEEEEKKEEERKEEGEEKKEEEDEEKKEGEEGEEKDVEAKKDEVTVEDTVPSIDSEVSQKTEGKFESFDELLTAYQELETKEPEVQELKFANPLIEKLNDLAEKGVEINTEFLQSQLVDYEVYSVENVEDGLNLVAKELKLLEPDISDKEIEFELKKRFKLDEDRFDEDEVEFSKMSLMRAAKKAKKALVENQKEMALPSAGQSKNLEEERVQQEQMEKAKADFELSVKKSVSDYNGESFKIGEDSFDYKIDDQGRKSLENLMNNTETFWNRYLDGDKKIDFNRFRKDMFILENHEKMLKSAISQALSSGEKEVVSGMKNSTLDKKSPTREVKSSNVSDQIFAHFGKK